MWKKVAWMKIHLKIEENAIFNANYSNIHLVSNWGIILGASPQRDLKHVVRRKTGGGHNQEVGENLTEIKLISEDITSSCQKGTDNQKTCPNNESNIV